MLSDKLPKCSEQFNLPAFDLPEINVEKQYQTLNEEVRRRGDLLAQTGAIFVVGVFILLSQATVASTLYLKIALVILALLVFTIWLFGLALTSYVLDGFCINYLVQLEEKGCPIKVHGLVRKYLYQHEKPPLWLCFRRFVYAILYSVFVFAGTMMILT